mmetsp:Transcript_23304/g.68673  ORF Transcript_23304/g.68673 Transcript_23304/m.68673 type:complete len:259 (+) Transcript_23304:580-1356(+)
MEGACVLACVEVDKAEVVRDDPLKGIEVEGALQARDGGDVTLLAEEAHSNVVPELRRIRRGHGGDPVLDKSHVHVRVVLDDGAGGKDGLGILGVVGERVTEEVESAVILSETQVEQPHRGEHLRVVWRELERLQVDLYSSAEVLLERVHLAQLDVGHVVLLDGVGLLEAVRRLVVLLEVHVAETLVVPDFPVVLVEPHSFLVNVQRGLVLAQKVERTAHLLEVVDVVRVQARGGLEELQGVLYFSSLALNESCGGPRA